MILSVFGFVLFQKNKKITIQKLQLEIQNSRNIDEINTTKKQFAERLISANQTINKKLDKLSSKLKNSEFSKNPEILQVRKELDSITQLKGEWNSELQQIESIEDIRYLHEHFQCIQNFNQTEQSLLALIVKGHKVKEIATLMNISEQHVRNTKTKVLKSMSREKGFVVTIDFLGKIQNNGPINL
jgi:DNA-binding CsgD family transcriptional regulator